MRLARMLVFVGCLALPAIAATKPHTVSLGRWVPVKMFAGETDDKPIDARVRPLVVDGHVKEFTIGDAHEVTERILVVQRAYRVNDWLPEDGKALPRWKWQRGGWLMVDRSSGRVSALNLPDFDPFYSTARWYRDYVAYCGLSVDGDKLSAVVSQIGRRKPLVKKALGASSGGPDPDSDCDAPHWQRSPVRVVFKPKGAPQLSFDVRGHSTELPDDSDKEN